MSYDQQTQHKPTIPYFATIPGGVSAGTLIIVYGRVPYGAYRFDVNYYVGSIVTHQLKSNGDIAFHFNPRFDERLVVRNSRQNGVWGPEEREPKSMPFECGKCFDIMILCEESGFKVAVNGRHFIDYYHRMPLTVCGVFSIFGSVEIDRVEYRREYRYRPNPSLPSPSFALTPVFNPPLPYKHSFGNGLSKAIMIYISGRMTMSANRFAIDFISGCPPNTDIAFHFNVRNDQRAVVRNTYRNKVWEMEEREVSHFPFGPGINFDMVIRVESDRYLVAVNGQHYVQYAHRIPLHSVNMLEINGDVMIASVRFAQT